MMSQVKEKDKRKPKKAFCVGMEKERKGNTITISIDMMSRYLPLDSGNCSDSYAMAGRKVSMRGEFGDLLTGKWQVEVYCRFCCV